MLGGWMHNGDRALTDAGIHHRFVHEFIWD